MSVSHYTRPLSNSVCPINSIYTPAISASALINNCPVTVGSSVSTITILASGLVGGIFSNIGTATTTMTTDTAVAIFAYLVSQGITPTFSGSSPTIGTAFDFRIVNASTGTATLAGGSGVLTQGTMTVATLTSKTFKFVFNSATSVTIYG